MPSDWPTVSLDDLRQPDRLITYGIVKVGDFVPDGVPVIRGGDIRDNRIVFDDKKRVSEEVSQSFRRTILQGGEIVINLIAEPGHTAIVGSAFRGANVSRDVAVIPLCGDVDIRFANYALQSPTTVRWLRARLQGSVTQKINLSTLREVPIPLPPLSEQHRIVAVLGALDDKIDLNRKMNRTLEEIAQAIFKSWFIDFDGVSPEDLVDSEIGPIPEGWNVGSLKDVADHIRDTVQPGSLDSDTPYVGLEHVPRRCATLDMWGNAADATSAKARFEPGDVLFGKLRPYFHKVVPAPCSGIASTDILVIRPKSGDWHPFVFGHLFSDAMVAHASAATDGTKMPRTKWTDLSRFPIAMPPAEVAARFEGVAAPLFDRLFANMRASRTLAELRGALLPKLLSGEIRVPEVEKAVEVAP